MKCIICDSENIKDTTVRRDEVIKEVPITYVAHVLKCANCGNEMSTTTMMKANLNASADAFRKASGLLTSEEIIAYRSSLGMSQNDFAEYLGVGSASIKRWETGHIQDKASDILIRAKSDPFYVEGVEQFLSSHSKIEPEFTGKKNFSFELFANALAMIIDFTNSKKYYFKALFYVDFIHYKKFEKGITGLHYNALPMGPIPNSYTSLENRLVEENLFEKVGHHEIKSKFKPNPNLFTKDELSTINIVIQKLKSDGKNEVFSASHEEFAYQNTDDGKKISYKLAKESSLF